jgi:Fe2+ or Zn2+ uptake regulation protein
LQIAHDPSRFVAVHTPTELATAFRAAGLKVTPQRQVLFRLLHDNHTHPTADALYLSASSQMPGISLRTVYQTLNDLAGMGELQMLDLGTGSARFDPNVSDHHHVVCDVCDQVRDVHVSGAGELAPLDADGFATARTQVVFRGQCSSCVARANPPIPTR